MDIAERVQAGREERRRTFRRQLHWAFWWALFCALWQPALYGLWQLYSERLGWWIVVPLWLLAGSPALTFFWLYHGRISKRRFLEMLLLFGPVTSIFVGWAFWSGVVSGGWIADRLW